MFLDFYLSSKITPIITGYSICNSPYNYRTMNTIELAIKQADHYPPTRHMFNVCQVGDMIGVKPGGNFFYENTTTNKDSILLICAGIGANPIVCILRHIFDLFNADDRSIVPHRVQFLYTAATKQDLVFRDSIEASCTETAVIHRNYFVTQETQIDNDANIAYRRMNESDLSATIEWLEKPVTAYVCGPTTFIDWIEITLKNLKVKKILYEKWW